MKRKIPWALRVALALGLGVIMFVYLRGRIPSDQDLRRQRTIESIEAISSAYQDYVGDNGSMPEELNNFKVTEAMLGANGSTKMYVSMSPGDMKRAGRNGSTNGERLIAFPT